MMTDKELDRDHWNKERTRDNSRIKTMTEAQHRAVSLLALYTYKVHKNKERIEKNDTVAKRIYMDFFTKTASTMLHAAGLPEIGINKGNFVDEGVGYVVEKSRKYLNYIDRKYGTWYAPLEYEYAA